MREFKCRKCGSSEFKWYGNGKNKKKVRRCAACKRSNHCEYQNELRRKLRLEIIKAYGGKCVCCDEAAANFLTIDHINGDGAAHKKIIGGAGNLPRWLKMNGFPKDNFRLLCYNCNCSLGFYGFCHPR